MSTPRHSRRVRIALAIVALLTTVYGWWYGEGVIGRLSDHRGFHLMAVEDRVGDAAAAALVRPRRVFLVLIDGLRADFAARLPVMQRLGELGVCRRTRVSLPTVSKPVYAIVSTGLEQDRTGARNNDDASPLAAESIWQVARGAGRRVAGFSEIAFWQELFPDGFDRYQRGARADDYFGPAARAEEDLVLVHPVYVDEAGHAHGAASRAYADAAARAGRELDGLLATLDLGRDTLVVTADHGHSATGGHGGSDPEIVNTLTCWVGRGVAHREVAAAAAPMDERSVGPLVAVLAGLRFPRHMRPGLGDAVWADLAAGLPAVYVADRRAAEARFAQAAAGLPELYARERRADHLRGAAALGLAALAFGLVARRRRLGLRGTAQLVAWLVAAVALHIAVYVAVRGSFEMTSINQRAAWIRASLLIGTGVGAAGVLAHLALFRDAARVVVDQLTLALAGVAATLVYALAFGWVLGFPLPGPALLYFPFFVAAFIITQGLVAFVTACAAPRRPRHVVPE